MNDPKNETRARLHSQITEGLVHGGMAETTAARMLADYVNLQPAPDFRGDPIQRALLDALEAIRDMEPEPPDPLPDHPHPCPECERWRNHPVQHMCDERYRALRHRDAQVEWNRAALGHRMRTVARDALARLDGAS